MKDFRRSLLIFFGIFWLGCIGIGVLGLSFYSHIGGEAEASPAFWPVASHLPHLQHSKTLLIFLHPDCSCSKATLAELSKVLVFAPPRLQTLAVFVRPTGWTLEQLRGDLWMKASSIPGVQPVVDWNTHEAELFGAYTSGHTLFYDEVDQLRFAGGITGARGHEGDNLGQNAVVMALRGETRILPRTKVFGCGLFDGQAFNQISLWASKLTSRGG